MAWTEQERTLRTLKEKYGPTAFTEEAVNYRRVGFKRGKETVSAVGDTWQEAVERLERKWNK